MSASSILTSTQPAPWWSFAHVWMVIAGPAVVVVASFITLYLAISSPNTVLEAEPSQPSQQGAQANANMAPAMLARNHAATGVVPVKPVTPDVSSVKP